MKQIAIAETGTELSKIIEVVHRTGEAVTLTRQGEPYVNLVPYQAVEPKMSWAEIWAEAGEIRKRLPPITMEEIQSAKEEGRR